MVSEWQSAFGIVNVNIYIIYLHPHISPRYKSGGNSSNDDNDNDDEDDKKKKDDISINYIYLCLLCYINNSSDVLCFYFS